MKYLVVSDSHGNHQIIEEIAELWKNQMDAMFHCGDSESLATDKVWENFFVVRGNMDYDVTYPDAITKTFGDDTIFMTHGHLYGINFSFDRLLAAAKEVDANICLYGHLHRAAAFKEDGILFLNPGSIQEPRGEVRIKAYAIIDSQADKYEIQYYDNKHRKIEELYFLIDK